MKETRNQAILCFQNIANLSDIEFEYESEEDQKIIVDTIQATIEGVLNEILHSVKLQKQTKAELYKRHKNNKQLRDIQLNYFGQIQAFRIVIDKIETFIN